MATCLLLATGPLVVMGAPVDDCESRMLSAPGYGEESADEADILVLACKAIAAGHYEQAVGLLQGLLLSAGDAPFVLLSVGDLYYQMRATETARYFWARAEEAARSYSPAIVDELDAARRARSAPASADAWAGVIQLGMRYQSNPTLAPESNEIEAGGFRFALPAEVSDAADWNLEVVSQLEHRGAVQPRYAWVSDASFYGAYYARQDRLNFSLLELMTGPEYASAPREFSGYSLRPHVIGLLSYFDNMIYEQTVGLGLDFNCRCGRQTEVRSTYQYRSRDFADTGDGSTSADRSGGEHRLELDFLKGVRTGQFVGIGLLARDVGADLDTYAYTQFEANVRVSFGARNVLFRDAPAMTVTPYAIIRRTEYDGTVLARASAGDQVDNEFRFGLVNRVPFGNRWALQLRLEYAEVDSNVSLYDARNELASVSVEKRF
jgi:hypothetical protein